eukprot:Sspe_Gene.108781::Locus_87913_Transcript_1_1_Confidence_1.000_Length_712::g.108781::m.108781
MPSTPITPKGVMCHCLDSGGHSIPPALLALFLSPLPGSPEAAKPLASICSILAQHPPPQWIPKSNKIQRKKEMKKKKKKQLEAPVLWSFGEHGMVKKMERNVSPHLPPPKKKGKKEGGKQKGGGGGEKKKATSTSSLST